GPYTPYSSSLSLHDALPFCPIVGASLTFGRVADSHAARRATETLLEHGHVTRVKIGRYSGLAGPIAAVAGKRVAWLYLLRTSVGDRKSTRLNSSHVSISYAF